MVIRRVSGYRAVYAWEGKRIQMNGRRKTAFELWHYLFLAGHSGQLPDFHSRRSSLFRIYNSCYQIISPLPLTKSLEFIYRDFRILYYFSQDAFTQILAFVYRHRRPSAIGVMKYHVASTLADTGKA